MDRFHLNLIYLYHTIVASEHLLIQAHARSSGEVAEYFSRHLEEERHHAEWLREDLLSVGVDPKMFAPSQLVKEMVGTVYYTIFHGDPAYLLGYMRMLESWKMSEEAVNQLKSHYPESLLRTFLIHRRDDPKHLEDLKKIVETLPQERKSVVDQAEAESYLYTCMMIQEFTQPPPSKAN